MYLSSFIVSYRRVLLGQNCSNAPQQNESYFEEGRHLLFAKVTHTHSLRYRHIILSLHRTFSPLQSLSYMLSPRPYKPDPLWSDILSFVLKKNRSAHSAAYLHHRAQRTAVSPIGLISAKKW